MSDTPNYDQSIMNLQKEIQDTRTELSDKIQKLELQMQFQLSEFTRKLDVFIIKQEQICSNSSNSRLSMHNTLFGVGIDDAASIVNKVKHMENELKVMKDEKDKAIAERSQYKVTLVTGLVIAIAPQLIVGCYKLYHILQTSPLLQ